MNLDKYWDGICADDVKALELLFDASYKHLVRYAQYLTEDTSASEEVVQDVYFKMWEDRHKIDIHGSLNSYLYKTVHNHCINRIASQNTKRNKVNRLLSEEKWQYIIEWLDYDDYIIEHIEAKETESKIKKIIEGLPEQCRKIFELSRFENKSNKEIALFLKISVNTVKVQIFRALTAIRKELF